MNASEFVAAVKAKYGIELDPLTVMENDGNLWGTHPISDNLILDIFGDKDGLSVQLEDDSD